MFNKMKNKVLGLLGFFAVASTSANAALAIDTTAITADIAHAGEKGLVIVLAVAAVAIGVTLVRKLVRA